MFWGSKSCMSTVHRGKTTSLKSLSTKRRWSQDKSLKTWDLLTIITEEMMARISKSNP